MARSLIFVAACVYMVACGDRSVFPAAPHQRTAFCGSSCWNDAQCFGQGFACVHCVAGTCSSRTPLALNRDPVHPGCVLQP